MVRFLSKKRYSRKRRPLRRRTRGKKSYRSTRKYTARPLRRTYRKRTRRYRKRSSKYSNRYRRSYKSPSLTKNFISTEDKAVIAINKKPYSWEFLARYQPLIGYGSAINQTQTPNVDALKILLTEFASCILRMAPHRALNTIASVFKQVPKYTYNHLTQAEQTDARTLYQMCWQANIPVFISKLNKTTKLQDKVMKAAVRREVQKRIYEDPQSRQEAMHHLKQAVDKHQQNLFVANPTLSFLSQQLNQPSAGDKREYTAPDAPDIPSQAYNSDFEALNYQR